MIRHVVVFRWTPEITPEQVALIRSELARLPSVVPSVRSFQLGPDAGITKGNADFAVAAEFDDAAGFAAYRDHPAHVAIIREHIAPFIAERLAVQFEA